jgi:hypothetical protein
LVDGSVRVFSRNGEESTSRFPDLIDMIKEFCKPVASTFIIDAEVHYSFLPYNKFRLKYTFGPPILSKTGF